MRLSWWRSLDVADLISLDAAGARAAKEQLAELLIDVVDAGASVSFLPPLARAEAEQFWERVAGEVEAGTRILLVARDSELGELKLAGTVQLELATQPNQRHRAAIAKLLVHTSARRRGLGRQLMLAAEREAISRGRSLLTFDTKTGGAAEQLYLSLGYQRAGVIPGYSLQANGDLGATSIFYKQLTSG
jgi:acetyltransferase